MICFVLMGLFSHAYALSLSYDRTYSSIDAPYDVDVDPDGNMYVVRNDYTESLLVLNSDGALLDSFDIERFLQVKWVDNTLYLLGYSRGLYYATDSGDNSQLVYKPPSGTTYGMDYYDGQVVMSNRVGDQIFVLDVDGATGEVVTTYNTSALIQETAIAVDPRNGRIYISDKTANNIYYVNDEGGLTLFVSDRSIYDLEVDANGYVYMGDTSQDAIFVYSPDGELAASIGSYGSGEGQFKNIRGLAIFNNELYVSDVSNDNIQVFDIISDVTPPDPPSSFIGSSTGSDVSLSWTNPEEDFESVTLRRSTESYPLTVTAGIEVTSSATVETFTDSELADGLYYYAIFALDSVGNVSTPSTSSVVVDTVAPDAVTGFSVEQSDDTVSLSWTNPEADFAGVTLRRSAESYPSSITDGTEVTSNSTEESLVQSSVADGTYYYSIFALDSYANVSDVATISVTVDDTAPSAVTDFEAEDVASTVNLTWTNPESDFASVTIRQSTESYPSSVTDGTEVTSNFTEESLSQSSIDDGMYYYSIFALDSYGNVSEKATASVVVDTTPPDAVSEFSAEDSEDTITLTWTNPESDFAGVTIRRNGGLFSGYPSTITDGTEVTSNSTAESLTETNVVDWTYLYSIFVLDSKGNVSEKLTAMAEVDTMAPSAVDEFYATASGNEIELTWTKLEGEFDSFTVRRSTETYPSTAESGTLVSSGSFATRMTDSELEDGRYYYSIFAVDGHGNVSPKLTATAVIDTIAPSAVSEFTVEESDDTVSLSWSNPEEDDFSGVTIRRSTESYPSTITDGTEVTSNSTAETLTQTSVEDGTYYYSIFALDNYENVSEVATASVLVDDTAPSGVTDVSIERTGDEVSLSWTNPESDFSSITLRRSTENYPNTVTEGVSITSNVSITSITDSGLEDGSYYYSIFALDSYENVSEQATASVVVDTIAPDAPEVTAAKVSPNSREIEMSWTVPEGTDTFELKRTYGFSSTTVVSTNISSSVTSYRDMVETDGTYSYSVYAKDEYGNTSLAGYTRVFYVDSVSPSAVSDFEVEGSDDTVILSWTNPEDDFESVTIRRSTESYPSSITDGTEVTSNSTEESLSQTSVEDGTYYYSIFALDNYENVSEVATASVLVDDTAPSAVTDFEVEESDDTVSLSWSNPEEDDFESVTIRRSTESYPSSITDGTDVTSNSTEESLSQTSVADGTYYYSIFALDSYENVSEVATVSVTVDDTAPSEVSDFEIDFIVSTVNLSWSNPVEDFVGVTIRRSEEGYPSSITDGVEVTSNSSAESLSQGSVEDGAYYYSIFALDSYGNVSEKATASVLIDTIAPDAPVVTAEKISLNSNVIDISWTVPEGTVMFEIRRLYTVWDVTVLERYMSSSVTSYRDTIESDGTYFYGVYATDEYGNKSLAGYSNSVVVDREAPSAVTEFEAEASDDTVSLSWTNPEEEDLAGVTIRRSSEGYPSSISDGVEVTSNFTEESLSQTSVEDGTYYYSIFALDLYTNVSLKATANVVVDTVSPDAPEVTFTKEDVTYLHLEWEGSEDTVAIIIEVSVDSGEYESVGRYGGRSSSYANPYAEDGLYVYRLYAEDESGNRSVAVTTNAEVIDTVSPDAPDLSAEKNRINGTTITLSWTVPESTSRFELRVSTGNSQSVVSTNIPSTVTDYTHTDLVDGTYEYSIYAIDAYGNSSEAGTATALVIDATAPSAVTDVAVEESDDRVSLSWSNPELDFESVTIRRSVESYPNSITEGTEVTSNSTAESLSQAGLEDGIYYYSIFALDSYGNVSEVSTISVTVDDTAPDAPELIAEKESANGSTITLTWTVPSGAASFELRVSSGNSQSVVSTNISSTVTEYTHTGLTDGTYSYSIYAIDGYDNMSRGGTSNALVIDTTAPESVTDLTGEPTGDLSSELSWETPEDESFSHVDIRRSESNFPGSITDGEAVTSSYTLESYEDEDLESGTYYYSIFSVDTYGNIGAPATVTVTITVSQENFVNDGHIGRGSVTIDSPQEEPIESPVVGSRGDVTVNVRTTFQSEGLVVGDTTDATSTIILDESDSNLSDSGDVVVGRKGQGKIVQSAGTMTVGGTLSLGHATDGTGRYELSGGELICDTLDLRTSVSSVNVLSWTGGQITPRQVVGRLSNNGGHLVVKSSAPVTIQGSYTQESSGTLHYVLDSVISSNRSPLITIDDGASLSGTIKLTLDGYEAEAGARIYLVNPDSVSSVSSKGLRVQSEITFDLEELEDGLEWDTSDFEVDGSIAIMSVSESLLQSKPLNYPNPFNVSSGTDIVYTLTRSTSLELRVYTAWGQEVYRELYASGENGGRVGANSLPISTAVTGESWPSGVYFYLLMENGDVVGKGKLAVKPE